MDIPSISRIVHYVLTDADVEAVRYSRAKLVGNEDSLLGKQISQGNPVSVGQHLPLIITNVWPYEFGGSPGVNGQVLLDGNDSLWITSVQEGTGPGTYHWPEREPSE